RASRLRAAGKLRELALKGLLESRAFGVRAIEIALHLRIIKAEIKIGEIPLRQPPERRCRALFRGMQCAVFCRHDFPEGSVAGGSREKIGPVLANSLGLGQTQLTPCRNEDLAAMRAFTSRLPYPTVNPTRPHWPKSAQDLVCVRGCV